MPSLDPEDLDAVLETLSAFAERELPVEFLLQLDHEDRFPHDALNKLYDPETVGLHLLFLPEEYGGLGGGAVDVYRVSEAMAAMDLGVATGVLATFLGTDPIRVGGTEEQKEEWMGRIAEEGLLVAYGASEPQAGSDLANLRTKAVRVEEDGEVVGYRISGAKQWISNGGVAKLFTILALAPDGPTWFVVEEGAEGFSAGKQEDKHGIRASNTAPLYLDNVYVDASALVGGVEGQGLAQAQAVFGYTRLMVAAFGLGAGWAAHERAIRYAQGRTVQGQPLSTKQGYTHKLLVANTTRLEAARAYIEWTAEQLDEADHGLATEGAVAKYMATEAGNKAAEDAIQALGGYGYTKEYFVEKIKRDVRITTIYEGTSEIMEWTIARDRWQQHLKSRGRYYVDWAEKMEALHRSDADCGAQAAAYALRSLSQVLEAARRGRLTRNQHILFRLGELTAWAETAAVFSERASTNAGRGTPLDADSRKAAARLHAREAAFKVAVDGARWVVSGAADPTMPPGLDLEEAMRLQQGAVADMDQLAASLVTLFPAD